MLSVHIGVYLGGWRFNSWDLVADLVTYLTTANDLTGKRPLLVIFITFVVITYFYWLIKQVTLGLLLRIRFIPTWAVMG